MRSTSLPRSLRSAVKEPLGGSKQSFERSASTEGRLDSRPDDPPPNPPKKSRMKKLKEKLRLSRSSKSKSMSQLQHSQSHPTELVRQASTSSSAARILDPGGGGGGGSMRRPKSMDLRPSRSQGALVPIHVQTPVSPAEEESGSRHVHVDIPSRPWTKPFADVKLRSSGQAKDDGHSSSGELSFNTFFVAR
jgi:hypothetical protein